MQVTGSNSDKKDQNMLSIRLCADGLYFHGEFQEGSGDKLLKNLTGILKREKPAKVTLEIDTHNTIFIPEQHFEKSLCEGYLSAHNIILDKDVPVYSVNNGVVALTVCPASVAELMDSKGIEVDYVSPAINVLGEPEKGVGVALFLTEKCAYVSVWKEGLKFVEVLPYRSEGDILYYITRLNEEFGTRKGRASVYGCNSQNVAALLKKSFRRISCEDNKR